MIGYYLFLGVGKLLMLMPRSWRKQIFFGIAKFSKLLSKKHQHIVRANLKHVYGDNLDEAFIEDIIDYGYQNLAINALFIIEAQHMSAEDLAKIVTIENLNYVEQAKAQNRPIVFVTSHFGVWELAGSAISALVEPILIIYKKMKNPHFQNYLLNSRSHFRMSYTERHGALKALIKQMRMKKSTAILIDTNVNPRDGILVDFLGKKTRQITTPAYLSRKLDAALIPGLIYTDDFNTYTIKLFPEIIIDKSDDANADIEKGTQEITNWLSEQIYEDPKNWFWMHRRWKNDYPEIYQK